MENVSEGKQLCAECYQARLTDRSIAPLTSNRWWAIETYREFSETCYAAGWVADPVDHRKQFVRYLEHKTAALQSKQQPEPFELDAVELLLDCRAEAGYPTLATHRDIYDPVLALEQAAITIGKVAAEAHHDFPMDPEARERAIGPAVAEHLTPVGAGQRTIQKIIRNVSRQLTATTGRYYHVSNIINEAILYAAERRAERNA